MNATPIYICRQIGNVWEAISNIMQSVDSSSPMKILIQKQLALTSWAGLLFGVYFHLCKPYRGEFCEVQSLRFSLQFRQIRKMFTSLTTCSSLNGTRLILSKIEKFNRNIFKF